MRLLVLAALVTVAAGTEQRYFYIDGAVEVQVSPHYWHRLLAEGWCSRVEHKAYPHLKNHLCYISGERLRGPKKEGAT